MQIANTTEPDKADIQGLILKGYTHPCSTHLLFNFTAVSGVPSFFTALLPYLRTAEYWGTTKPEMMLNIGLTFGGVKLLRPSLTNFPDEFVAGPEKQLDLHDYGDSDPKKWWNGKFDTDKIHCIVHAYALAPTSMTQLVKLITDAAIACGTVSELLPMNTATGRLEQYELPDDKVHFGYKDSIDVPALTLGQVTDVPKNTEYLSNFLLGYEVNSFTIAGPAGASPEAAFAKNGCYNAFRVLNQNEPAFEDFLDNCAAEIKGRVSIPDGAAADYLREWVAAKLNGRWRNGSPLDLSPNMPEPATAGSTAFTYADDVKGAKCPFSAHTRVANPRSQALGKIERITGVPAIIRRGVPYGAPYSKQAGNEREDRGLIGLFLCGSLKYQFQELYRWMNVNDFSPGTIFPYPHIRQDALVANRTPPSSGKVDNRFSILLDDGTIYTTTPLPQFVNTRGTAYCLLPSISTIKAIAGALG